MLYIFICGEDLTKYAQNKHLCGKKRYKYHNQFQK